MSGASIEQHFPNFGAANEGTYAGMRDKLNNGECGSGERVGGLVEVHFACAFSFLCFSISLFLCSSRSGKGHRQLQEGRLLEHHGALPRASLLRHTGLRLGCVHSEQLFHRLGIVELLFKHK